MILPPGDAIGTPASVFPDVAQRLGSSESRPAARAPPGGAQQGEVRGLEDGLRREVSPRNVHHDCSLYVDKNFFFVLLQCLYQNKILGPLQFLWFLLNTLL